MNENNRWSEIQEWSAEKQERFMEVNQKIEVMLKLLNHTVGELVEVACKKRW